MEQQGNVPCLKRGQEPFPRVHPVEHPVTRCAQVAAPTAAKPEGIVRTKWGGFHLLHTTSSPEQLYGVTAWRPRARGGRRVFIFVWLLHDDYLW